jgi:hypothetical protein
MLSGFEEVLSGFEEVLSGFEGVRLQPHRSGA